MKRIIMIAAICGIVTMQLAAQVLAPKGIKVGPDKDATIAILTKIKTLGPNKVGIYSGNNLLTVVSADTVAAKGAVVLYADSNYQKPGSYTTRYDFKNESLLPLWVRTLKALGLNIKGTSVAMEFAQPISNGTMVDGQIHWELVTIRDSVTITSITFMLQTAGTSTFDAYNGIGIYSISGGTATKLTETANSSTIWTSGANVSNTVNLPTPILLVPGNYYFAFNTNWSTAGTVPVIYQANYGMWASKASFTNGLLISGKTTSQAALPASVSIGTFSSDNYGYGLYYQ